MPDFAASDTNRSTAYGRTGNAYDVRFSPGGSSGRHSHRRHRELGVLGNGTDTGNSIRMPSSTSSVVGMFPTRGLVSIAGIAPLDWLLDNTGPIARNVTDAVIALERHGRRGSPRPAHDRLRRQSPARPVYPIFEDRRAEGQTLRRAGICSYGSRHSVSGHTCIGNTGRGCRNRPMPPVPLRPETREAFMKAIEGLRAAGATVVFDDSSCPTALR